MPLSHSMWFNALKKRHISEALDSVLGSLQKNLEFEERFFRYSREVGSSARRNFSVPVAEVTMAERTHRDSFKSAKKISRLHREIEYVQSLKKGLGGSGGKIDLGSICTVIQKSLLNELRGLGEELMSMNVYALSADDLAALRARHNRIQTYEAVLRSIFHINPYEREGIFEKIKLLPKQKPRPARGFIY